MVRILYLSRGGRPAGSQRQLERLLAGMDRRRYQPLVVCSEDGPFVEVLRGRGIETVIQRLHPWRKLRSVGRRGQLIGRLVRLAKAHGADLIHCSYLWHHPYAWRVAERCGVPVILHVRCRLSRRDVAKHECIRADQLIAISRRIRRQLISGGIPPEAIAQVVDAVDLERFRPRETRRLHDELGLDGRAVIGIVGRVCPEKRQLEFIRAAARARGNGLPAEYVIIGSPGSRRYQQEVATAIAEGGLSDRVHLIGWREDMPDVLSSLDVLVSLSGGSVLYEAMSCGRAVLSAGFTRREDADHLRDGRTGVLLETADPETLAGAMATLVQDADLRERLGAAARRRARRYLSQASLVERTEAIYASVLAERSGAR